MCNLETPVELVMQALEDYLPPSLLMKLLLGQENILVIANRLTAN